MAKQRLAAPCALLLVGIAAHALGAQTPAPITQDNQLARLLEKAGSYLDSYAPRLATVTAQERYEFKGTRVAGTLFSDIMLVGLGNEGSWVEFRDVYQVNNRPVRDHQARLEALLGDPNTLMAKGQEIMNESAKHNQGVMNRNINVPTMALTYLMKSHQWRSSFKILGAGDRASTIVGFTETARPPLIYTDVGIIQTSGRFWLDSSTGAVLKSELVLKNPEGGPVAHDHAVDGVGTVTYQTEKDLGLLVPATMDEDYKQPTWLTGHAVYSGYRSFGVVVKTGRSGGF